MTKISKKLRDASNELSRATESLITPSQLAPLLSLGKSYAKIQELWCNESMDDQRTKRVEKRETRLETEITTLALALPGVTGVRFTGDPRGYCVKLMLASKRYNTWGGESEGWGIA